MNNKIELIVGCMFSGKTNHVIEKLNDYSKLGYKCIAYKPSSDTRFEYDLLRSRTGKTFKAKQIPYNIFDVTGTLLQQISNYDIIAFDEAQFFIGIYDLLYTCNRIFSEKVFLISGLDSDFMLNDFGEIASILKISTHIHKLHAICECGSIAICNYRITDEVVQVVVGDADKYKALCLNCYNFYSEMKKDSNQNLYLEEIYG